MMVSRDAVIIPLVVIFLFFARSLVAAEDPLQRVLQMGNAKGTSAELHLQLGTRSAERPALHRRGRQERERKERQKAAERAADDLPPLRVPPASRFSGLESARPSLESVVTSGSGSPDSATIRRLQESLRLSPPLDSGRPQAPHRHETLDLGGSRVRPKTDASYEYLELVARGAELREGETYGIRVAQITPRHVVKLVMGPIARSEEVVDGRPAWVLKWIGFAIWLTDRGPSSNQWEKHWELWRPPKRREARLPVFLGQARPFQQAMMNCE